MKTCTKCSKLRDESMVCKCCTVCIECDREHVADAAERERKKPTAQVQSPAVVA